MTRTTDPLDRISHALADPTRRALWRQLGATPGATTAQLADLHPAITRWAVMKHLGVLRAAGLVQTLPSGRRRHHYRVPHGLDPLRGWLDEDRAG